MIAKYSSVQFSINYLKIFYSCMFRSFAYNPTIRILVAKSLHKSLVIFFGKIIGNEIVRSTICTFLRPLKDSHPIAVSILVGI